jgi:hypothetical protein
MASVKPLKEGGDAAEHSMLTDDHGTPPEFCDLSRHTLGEIDLDPSSSDYWNHWHVKAKRIYTERDDFTKQQIFGRVHWNPPGGEVTLPGNSRPTSLVRIAWRMLIDAWKRGECSAAIWIGYNLQQLTMLQSEPVHPLQFMTLFPCERLKFYTRAPGNGPPIESTSPRHGNYVTLLHTRSSPGDTKAMMQRFVERANRLDVSGAIVRPL